MKLSEINLNTHFVQINLSDLLEQLGEDEAKDILSSFSCPLNADVEKFLREKAIEFSKRGFSKTHLVYWTTQDEKEKELVGYYTIASKFITIQRQCHLLNENSDIMSEFFFSTSNPNFLIIT